jgi:hypothetical protein
MRLATHNPLLSVLRGFVSRCGISIGLVQALSCLKAEEGLAAASPARSCQRDSRAGDRPHPRPSWERSLPGRASSFWPAMPLACHKQRSRADNHGQHHNGYDLHRSALPQLAMPSELAWEQGVVPSTGCQLGQP